MFKKYDAGAGFRRGSDGDCTVRATAVALGIPYPEAWELLYREQGKHRNAGYALPLYLKSNPELFGVVRYIPFPAKAGHARMTAQTLVREYPKGRFILKLAHHVAAVVDGILFDIWDSSRKCVYGAWEINPSKKPKQITAPSKDCGGGMQTTATVTAGIFYDHQAVEALEDLARAFGVALPRLVWHREAHPRFGGRCGGGRIELWEPELGDDRTDTLLHEFAHYLPCSLGRFTVTEKLRPVPSHGRDFFGRLLAVVNYWYEGQIWKYAWNDELDSVYRWYEILSKNPSKNPKQITASETQENPSDPVLSEMRRWAGRAGGLKKTQAKTQSARINGARGGRPRKVKEAK